MEDAYKEWIYNEIFRAIKEFGEEAQQESDADREDEFKAGRALGFREMNEIIDKRLKMLEDEDEEQNSDEDFAHN